MSVNLKTVLVPMAAIGWLGAAASPAHASNLERFVEQAMSVCEDVSVDRVPLNSLNLFDWHPISRDQKDHGKAGKQYQFTLLHTKVPWLTLNISASGVGSTFGISKRACSLNYNGVRHSFDNDKKLSWVDLSPEEISKEFSEQLHGLAKTLKVQKFESFKEDVFTDEKEVALKKCDAGVRFKASLILHNPEDDRVDGFFSLSSTDWGKPC